MKHPITTDSDLEGLQFNDAGLIPVVAQDAARGTVLMLAWANKEALAHALEVGEMTYFSRSRNSLWTKGSTSGHTQRVISLAADCDRDAVLARVEQVGPACHEGTDSCWSQGTDPAPATWLDALQRMAAKRQANPTGRYTDKLLAEPAFVAAKIVEEAQEVASVLRGEPNEDTLSHEAADLLYHLAIALQAQGTPIGEVLQELAARSKPSAPE